MEAQDGRFGRRVVYHSSDTDKTRETRNGHDMTLVVAKHIW